MIANAEDSKKKPQPYLLKVAKDARGTHSLQCFFEVLNKPSFCELITETMMPHVLKFAYNKHSTHVLIKYIKLANIFPYLIPVYDLLVKNMVDLSQDANGLPVVKTCI